MQNLMGFEQFVNEEFGSGDAVACGTCSNSKKKKKIRKKPVMKWSKDMMSEGCGCNKKKKRRIRKPLKMKDALL